MLALDPSLIFSEILGKPINGCCNFLSDLSLQGVIKGSESAILVPEGHLSRKAYIDLSNRTQPTFSANRDVVYNIFEAYQARKQERHERDVADRYLPSS